MLDVTSSDFVTIGVLVALEGLLSADNALVMAVLVLGLPPPQHSKALRYVPDRPGLCRDAGSGRSGWRRRRRPRARREIAGPDLK